VISALFGWQGPSDSNPNGNPQFYANNLVAGGTANQQKSNGAFYKNARGALKKLNRKPKTAANAPGLSEKDRVGRFKGEGQAGNPDSKAKNFVSVQV
jgi:hypothetical protein